MGKHHGMRRGMYELFLQSNTRSAAGSTASGRFGEFFGFLFDRESTTTYTEAQLIALAEKMTERVGDPPADLNTPIGFAFLGQFIDHDTTLDVVTALGEAAGDITKIRNVRTPRLELDSVYLSGPDGSEYLYEEDKLHLTLGTRNNPLDLQRNRNNIAIIGDSRNDENLFINQLHGLFIRFHNWVVDQGKTFEEARQFVRWTYQKIVVEEFLAEVIADSTYNPIRTEFETNKRLPRPVNWNRTVALPIEFSAAAYRFGHSHVRQDYQINDSLTGNLFRFGGFQPVRPEQNIDWKYFFDIDGSSFLKARPIDTKLAKDLADLPFVDAGGISNLAARNLIRGQRTFGLISGEKLSEQVFRTPALPKHPAVTEVGLATTPLWFYILHEAEQNGGRLGQIGGYIVACTLLNMLLLDEESYINQDPGFDPFSLLPASGSMMAGIVNAVSMVPA